jgi:hypothetical protein
MADGPFDPATEGLVPRDPSLEDLVNLCRELNACRASYLVVGGFAIRASGYPRHTVDVDLLVASQSMVIRELAGVPIPFASPELLWRMKRQTHREKDAPDLLFLRKWFEAQGPCRRGSAVARGHRQRQAL